MTMTRVLRSRPPFLRLLLLTVGLNGISGAAPDRKDSCSDYTLPAEYEKYLDTDFLGSEQFLAVGSVNFSYHRFGPLSSPSKPGRTLVMIVGLGCTQSTWTPDLLRSLAADREVVIFDNRGSGHSKDKDWPDSITLDGFAQSTLDFIDTLGLQQPDILGWSMGGAITLQIATHYSNMVHSLVIVNSAIPKPSTLATMSSYLTEERAVTLWRGQLDPAVLFPNTSMGNAALCRYIELFEVMPHNSITQDEVKAQRRALLEAYKSTEIADRVKNITNPALMFVGTFAGEGPSSYDLEAQISNSMVIGFSNAAHGAIFQHSIFGARLITDFLDSGLGVGSPETAESIG